MKLLERIKDRLKKVDTYSYQGWLVSDRIIKRAVAVYLHSVIGAFTVVGLIALLGVLLSLW